MWKPGKLMEMHTSPSASEGGMHSREVCISSLALRACTKGDCAVGADMHPRAGCIPKSDPLAYFLTWTTYGTWLPGDARGWVRKPGQFQIPDPKLEAVARELMSEEPCILDSEERRLVEKTIQEHCAIRSWHLHAVSCRTNHVHVVVTAPVSPQTVRNQFKAWCTRYLKEHQLAPPSATRLYAFVRTGGPNVEVSVG